MLWRLGTRQKLYLKENNAYLYILSSICNEKIIVHHYMIKRKYKLTTVLVLLGSLSLSLEWIFVLMGNVFGLSLNWIVFPLVLLVDIASNSQKYTNPRVFKWVLLLLFPLLLFFLFTNDRGVPLYLTRFPLVKAGFNAIIIFIFFMVNGGVSSNRTAMIYGLFIGGSIGVITQYLAMAGFISGTIHYSYLKGLNVGMNRVSALGDSNQSIIYVLSVGVFIYWNNIMGKVKKKTLFSLLSMVALIGYAASTGSRAGSVAIFCVVFLSFYFSRQFINKQAKRKIFIAAILVFVFLIFYKSSLFQALKVGLVERWIYASRYSDDSVGHRVGAYEWLISNLIGFPKLIGVGYYKYGTEVRKYLPGGDWEIRWPHSSVVDTFIIGGLPLFILYLYLWIKSFRSLNFIRKQYSNCKTGIEAGFFFILLVGILLTTISLSILWIKITWAVLGVSFGLRYSLLKNNKRERKCV